MKKRILLLALALLTALTGGRGPQESTDAAKTDNAAAVEQSETAEPDSQETQETSADEFSFADAADREFYFSSGAGGWYTLLYIHADGSFDGYYQDSDMGDTGDEYPNGTVYYSEFTGRFTEPENAGEKAYRFRIEEIEYPLGFRDEIRDGIRYRHTDAYGLAGAEDLYLYLPGKKTADLPEEYIQWVNYWVKFYQTEDTQETELPFYGLYNEKMGEGFSSRAIELPADISIYRGRQIRAVILDAQEEADRLEEDLQHAPGQTDLNIISGEICKVWDDALDTAWGILEEHLDPTSMGLLTEEEQYWTSRKEEAVREAGAEFEGGTIQPLVMNSEAAKLTRYRVYELAAEAGTSMDEWPIYGGRYYDRRIELYRTGEMEDAPPLTYREILIRNVSDDSFDFTVNELETATDEGSEILSGSARIRDDGRSAVYEGPDFTLTFHFESMPAEFPKLLTVEGWEKLDGKMFVNNTILGHESG